MGELADDVVDEAVRLTRLAGSAGDEAEASACRSARDALLADHGFRARVRTDDDVLVCYPSDWIDAGVVDPEAIEDTGRAIERPLDGTGEANDWAAVDRDNRAVVDRVAVTCGPVHAATAAAFADFMGNHYARPIGTAGAWECREFLDEYLPRNAWPSEDQLAVAPTSVRLSLEAADAAVPPGLAHESAGNDELGADGDGEEPTADRRK